VRGAAPGTLTPQLGPEDGALPSVAARVALCGLLRHPARVPPAVHFKQANVWRDVMKTAAVLLAGAGSLLAAALPVSRQAQCFSCHALDCGGPFAGLGPAQQDPALRIGQGGEVERSFSDHVRRSTREHVEIQEWAMVGVRPVCRLRGGGLFSRGKTVTVPRFEPPPPYSTAVAKDSAWTDIKVCISAIARLMLRLAWYMCRLVARMVIRVVFAVVHVVAGIVGGARRSRPRGEDDTDWFVASLGQQGGTAPLVQQGQGTRAAADIGDSRAYLEKVSPALFSPDRSRRRRDLGAGSALPEHLWRQRAAAAGASDRADDAPGPVAESPVAESVHVLPPLLAAADWSPSALKKSREPFTPSKTFFTPSQISASAGVDGGEKQGRIPCVENKRTLRGGNRVAGLQPLAEPFCSSVSD
jgi:hypothetical protein